MTRCRRQLLMYGLFSLLPLKVRAACTITEPNSLGPFYRRDAPFTTSLAAADEPGEPLTVSGRVLAADSCQPLVGAIVDVWHANENGRYYDVGSEAGTVPAQFKLRGRLQTNERGAYEFYTILPGVYGSRPKHIHYIVYHPLTEPFVTQLYFEGDPRLKSDRLAHDSLVRPLKTGSESMTMEFDIVLKT